MKKNFLKIAYHSGEWKAFEDCNMSIATHALHYGIASFGWLRAIQNPDDDNEFILFRIDKHAKRLANSWKYLWANFSEDFIKDKLIDLIKKNKPSSWVYIRPLIYTSDLDLSPRIHDIEKDFLVYGLELWNYFKAEGLNITISSYMRQSDASFPLRWKISWAYITSALAKTEAIERWFDDAILLNSNHKVSEGSAMNIFIVRDSVIYTPPVTEDILEGITRESLITIARDLWYEVIERVIDKTELFIADEVFFTWTAAQVTPANKIEQYVLPKEKPVFEKLKKEFSDIASWKNPKYEKWLTRIKL